MTYYINYNDKNDTPHYGEYNPEIHQMNTGKNHSKEFTDFEEAKAFLKSKFGIDWEED